MLKRRLIGVVVGVGALIGGTTLVRADEPYIPLISKGFQHQFWQAVKAGAEQSAKAQNVRISFEGPDLKKKNVKIDSVYVRKQLAEIVKDQDLSRYIL